MIAAKRARQLAMGADPLVPLDNDKPTVLALREIADNLITDEVLEGAVVQQDDIEALIEGDIQQPPGI